MFIEYLVLNQVVSILQVGLISGGGFERFWWRKTVGNVCDTWVESGNFALVY